MRRIAVVLLGALSMTSGVARAAQESPLSVDYCEMATNPARYASKVVSTRAALVILRKGREWAIDGSCVKPSLLAYLSPSPVAVTKGMRALFETQRLGYGYFEGTFVGRFDVADVAIRPLGPPMLFGRGKLATRFVLIDVVDTKFAIVPKR